MNIEDARKLSEELKTELTHTFKRQSIFHLCGELCMNLSGETHALRRTIKRTINSELNNDKYLIEELFVDLQEQYVTTERSFLPVTTNEVLVYTDENLLSILQNRSKVLIGTTVWNQCVGSTMISSRIEPSSKYNLLTAGTLGRIGDTTIYTDAYRHPQLKIVDHHMVIPIEDFKFSINQSEVVVTEISPGSFTVSWELCVRVSKLMRST